MNYPICKLKRVELEDATNKVEIDEDRLVEVSRDSGGWLYYYKHSTRYNLDKRCSGDLKGKAIFLSNELDWKIVKDSGGRICLIALRKTNE